MKFKYIYITLALTILLLACEKTEVGYLSDNIFYRVNPFNVQQGITTFSSAIVANGSTSPLNVSLTAIRDADGNDIMEEFTTPQSIVTFINTITYEDSTLELLSENLKDSLVTPFAVNSIGGRLEFSAATAYLDTGTFYIDVEVSNTKGAYTIENACQINLQPVEEEDTYSMNYKRIQMYDTDKEEYILSSTSDSYITVTTKYISGVSNGAHCIYMFKDKNGDYFNPSKGEVTRRSKCPFFDDWAPWYEIELTDTAFVHQMPAYSGINFPYFNDLVVDGTSWSDVSARYDWVIPKEFIKDAEFDLKGMISYEYFAVGTFLITVQLHQHERISN